MQPFVLLSDRMKINGLGIEPALVAFTVKPSAAVLRRSQYTK